MLWITKQTGHNTTGSKNPEQKLGRKYICAVLILLCVSIMVTVNLVLNSVTILAGCFYATEKYNYSRKNGQMSKWVHCKAFRALGWRVRTLDSVSCLILSFERACVQIMPQFPIFKIEKMLLHVIKKRYKNKIGVLLPICL